MLVEAGLQMAFLLLFGALCSLHYILSGEFLQRPAEGCEVVWHSLARQRAWDFPLLRGSRKYLGNIMALWVGGTTGCTTR